MSLLFSKLDNVSPSRVWAVSLIFTSLGCVCPSRVWSAYLVLSSLGCVSRILDPGLSSRVWAVCLLHVSGLRVLSSRVCASWCFEFSSLSCVFFFIQKSAETFSAGPTSEKYDQHHSMYAFKWLPGRAENFFVIACGERKSKKVEEGIPKHF